MQNNTHIVYLEPVGAGAFKTPLRSDTLWGALCWAIRMVYDNKQLEDLLNAYEQDPDTAFYLSSTFPYKVEGNGEKVRYFPYPILPFAKSERIVTDQLKPWEIKAEGKKLKDAKKIKKALLNQAIFEKILHGRSVKLKPTKAPAVISRAFTHNTIDRITGSTLTLNNSGQLYHTDEYFITEKFESEKEEFRPDTHQKNGLFFLLRATGKTLDVLQGALRFLTDYGIGGDRSIGKGRFTISEAVPFEIEQPVDANARLNLSLYTPTVDEIRDYEGAADQYLFNYQLEDRWGRTQWQRKDVRNDKAFLFFKEGSVFPRLDSIRQMPGRNPIVGEHQVGKFPIYRYGHAFMLDIKIPKA